MDRRRLLPAAYTVAWVSALPVESAAAAEILDKRHEDPQNYENNTEQYEFGQIGDHNIVLVRLPSGQIGNSAAAAVTARVTTLFPSIRFALLVGIGGGVPSSIADIRLGDVVIGHPYQQHGGVVQYDMGKTGPHEKITRTGRIDAPPKVILNAIARLRGNRLRTLSDTVDHMSVFDQLPQFNRRGLTKPDVLYRSTYHHPGGETCEGCNGSMIIKREQRIRQTEEDIVIHYGTIASANQVMKDGLTRDRLSAELGGVLCFDMEAAGVASTFPSVVIRGICDYADSHKNKTWQGYAAATASAVAKELLLIIPGSEITKRGRAKAETNSNLYQVNFSLKCVPQGKCVDRPEEIHFLEQCLLPKTSSLQQQVAILYGMGGIGKTQLAVEFARRNQSAFTSTWWLDGNTENSLKQSIASCIAHVPGEHIPEARRKYLSESESTLEDAVDEFMKWLRIKENSNWLLIFDNVDRDYQQLCNDPDAYDISKYIPEADHGSVLITTRLINLQHLGRPLRVPKVSSKQAQELLQLWTEHHLSSSEADELIQLLDGLPLALAQAAAYVSETGMSFKDYIRLYNAQWSILMEEGGDLAPLKGYGNRSIKTTWMVSYQEVRTRSEIAANFLLLWAHLSNKTLPFWIFRTAFKCSNQLAEESPKWLQKFASDEMEYHHALRLLRRYCLVESWQGENSMQKTHPVVHDWAFHIQTDHQKATLSRLGCLVIAFAESKSGFYHMHRQRVSHMESWAERADKMVHLDVEIDEMMLRALHALGSIFHENGNYVTATKILERAVKGGNKSYGIDHPSTLWNLHQLALVYGKQGRLEEAEDMLQDALERLKNGPVVNHRLIPETSVTLAHFYCDQDRLEEAERMLHQVLERYAGAMRNSHESTLTLIKDLGLLNAEQRKSLVKESFHLDEKPSKNQFIGADDNNDISKGPIKWALESLGAVYTKQGKLKEAERIYQHMLDHAGKDLGADQSSIVFILHGLGLTYHCQGKLIEAERAYQRALDSHEKTLGADHIHTLRVVFHLALLYEDDERISEAEKMFQRALSGYEVTFGPSSFSTVPEVLKLLFRYGWLLQNQGRFAEAKLMYEKVVKGYGSVFGTDYFKYQDIQWLLQYVESFSDATSASTTTLPQQEQEQQEDACSGSARENFPTIKTFQPKTSKRERFLKKLRLRWPGIQYNCIIPVQ